MPWAELPDEVLEVLRANLVRGLDLVVAHLDAGTLHVTPEGGASSPAESGWLTAELLRQVDTELATRSGPLGS